MTSRRTSSGVPSVERVAAGLVDAHAHTWSQDFDGDYVEVIERAWAAGLVGVVEVGTSTDTSLRALDLARRDPRVHAAAGLHPHEARRLEEERAGLERLVSDGGFVAVGEIGLDFFRNLSPPEGQYAALQWQLELAAAHALPVVIHARNADEECFAVLEAWGRRFGRYLGAEREIGMMHCFAGPLELARRYVELGFLISVPGTVTYANNQRGQAVARELALTSMLVETDCPYLTPQPFRGGRNEPALVTQTAQFVAALRGCSVDEVARETTSNASRLFGVTF